MKDVNENRVSYISNFKPLEYCNTPLLQKPCADKRYKQNYLETIFVTNSKRLLVNRGTLFFTTEINII